MTFLFSYQFGFLAYYLQYWHKHVHVKVFYAFGGHFGSHIQYHLMKYKMNDLAYLNLHLAVYLCCKMIYVRAMIKKASIVPYLNLLFYLSLPHPLLGYLKPKINIRKVIQTRQLFVLVS